MKKVVSNEISYCQHSSYSLHTLLCLSLFWLEVLSLLVSTKSPSLEYTAMIFLYQKLIGSCYLSFNALYDFLKRACLCWWTPLDKLLGAAILYWVVVLRLMSSAQVLVLELVLVLVLVLVKEWLVLVCFQVSVKQTVACIECWVDVGKVWIRELFTPPYCFMTVSFEKWTTNVNCYKTIKACTPY